MKEEPTATDPGLPDAASIAEELRQIIRRQRELEEELLGLHRRADALGEAMKRHLERHQRG